MATQEVEVRVKRTRGTGCLLAAAAVRAGENILSSLQSDNERLRLQVQQLRANEEIRNRIYDYTRALDRLDRRLLADQFWPDARVDYGAFYQGLVGGFIDAAMRFQSAMRDTQHLVESVGVTLSEDSADVESYVHATHVLMEGGELVQLSVGARYRDRFERRHSTWRLSSRTEIMDGGRWIRIPDGWRGLARELPKGLRGRTDLAHRFSLVEP